MVTICDIAKEFKLSPATVSLALNNDSRVNDDTRRQIQAYAQKVNYRRNEMARSLRTRRGTLIGALVHNACSVEWARVLHGIESEIAPLGYGLVMCTSGDDEKKEDFYIERMLDRRLDGIILQPSGEKQKGAERLAAEGTPTVLLDRSANPDICFVKGDDAECGRKAAELFIGSGRKRFAYMCSSGFRNFGSLDRFIAFRETLQTAGLWDDLMAVTEDFELVNGGPLVQPKKGFLERNPEILEAEAIFVGGDALAWGLMQELENNGRICPRDYHLLSWGDNSWLCGVTRPRISSIANDWEGIGKAAAHCLLDLIKNKKVESMLLPEKFIFRDTLPEKATVD